MKEKRKFSSEQKAQIVLSVIKKEATALEMGKKYDISPGLISKWKDSALEKFKMVFETSKEDKEVDRELNHLKYVVTKITTQNDFLEKVLAATR